jgi:MFS transporter, DHA1 family, multidrug resistance protein
MQYSFLEVPQYISGWTTACLWGPDLGPVITGFAIQAKVWQWGLWEILWLSAPVFVLFFFFCPETSSDNILQRRARRLRKLTGRSNIRTGGEIAQRDMSVKDIATDALIKPAEIMSVLPCESACRFSIC